MSDMPQDPGEVVLSSEEYLEFQQMLARPPRAIPALVRLLKIQRLQKEADAYRALAQLSEDRAAVLQESITTDRARIVELEARLAQLRAEPGKEYPGEDADPPGF